MRVILLGWAVIALLSCAGCPSDDEPPGPQGDDDVTSGDDDDATAGDDDDATAGDDDDDDTAGDDDDATPGDDDDTVAPPCPYYESQEEEYAPIQTAGGGLPGGAGALSWERPAEWVYLVDFSGTPGQPASHEGTDYVHDDPSAPNVVIRAAAAGQVVYVRLGCPQSSEFAHNNSLRECGSGWGNHVVVGHGGDLYTRYAHLQPGSAAVEVGDAVAAGSTLARMGNSGRSETRHLHFELGEYGGAFDPCAAAQSMDTVFDSELLSWP